MGSVWERLAEALGIEDEATNWDRVNKARNMQRYGAQDRRVQMGPQSYFNTRGTGLAQRQAAAANAEPQMTPRQGGLQIPQGMDRPGQPNPLFDPPQKKTPLSKAPNAPDDDESL